MKERAGARVCGSASKWFGSVVVVVFLAPNRRITNERQPASNNHNISRYIEEKSQTKEKHLTSGMERKGGAQETILMTNDKTCPTTSPLFFLSFSLSYLVLEGN